MSGNPWLNRKKNARRFDENHEPDLVLAFVIIALVVAFFAGLFAGLSKLIVAVGS